MILHNVKRLSLIVAAVSSGLLASQLALAQEKLPTDLKWESNNTDPTYASPEAKRGGVYHEYQTSFPITLRYVGPDSNGSFAGQIRSTYLSLVDRHPNTLNVMPMLANEWAYGKDKKTMYFRINKNAKWSDGVPVTADDFVFTNEMMRMKEINDPFQADYFAEDVEKVTKYDSRTLSITEKNVKPDLDLYISLTPMPKHYFAGKIDKNFVQKFNWDYKVPVTGPYMMSKVEKGKMITFKRLKNWWGDNERFFKHRFNVDEIQIRVIRDDELAFEAFRKGDIDQFWATRPVTWHDKCKGDIWDKGYVEKVWAYNDAPQGAAGFFINTDNELFKDLNARFAFAHAMNFKLVIDKLLYGDYEQGNTMFDGYGPYSNLKVKAREYSIAKVKEYLEKSGWARDSSGIYAKNGKKFSVEVLTSPSPQILKRLEVLREEAKKAGVEMNLKGIDDSLMFKTALEKKHQVAYISMGGGLRPSPWEYLHSDNAIPQTNNFFMLRDADMDTMTKAYRVSSDAKEQQELSRKIIQRTYDLGIFIPMFKVPFARDTYWRWWRLPKIPGTSLSNSSLFDSMSLTAGGLFWLDTEREKETKAAMKAGKTFAPVVIKDTTFKR